MQSQLPVDVLGKVRKIKYHDNHPVQTVEYGGEMHVVRVDNYHKSMNYILWPEIGLKQQA